MCPRDETDSERQRCTPHSIAEYTVPLERHNRTLQPCAGNNVSTHRFIVSGVRTTPAHLEIWPPYLDQKQSNIKPVAWNWNCNKCLSWSSHTNGWTHDKHKSRNGAKQWCGYYSNNHYMLRSRSWLACETTMKHTRYVNFSQFNG